METVGRKKRVVYIVNPISGKGKTGGIGKIIGKETEPGILDWEVVISEYPGHAEHLARKAAETGADIVAAVGGDGTVNEVARGIIGSGAALGIVPAGSGNGLANHLGIPSRPAAAVRLINAGKIQAIDTARLNGKLFVSLAGAGFDAMVAKRFALSGKRGFVTYARVAISAYLNYEPRKFSITADGTTFKRKGIFVSFANSNQFGNHISVDPLAELNDGWIDICIVRKIPLVSLFFLTPAVFLKKIHRTRYVEIIKAKDIYLKRKRGKWVHLDGDPWKAGKEVHVVINPLSLQVVVP